MNNTATEEKRTHSSKLVPYSYYQSEIPTYFSCVPLHWHSEFEINYILKGKGELVCGDDKVLFEEGDILLFQPNILHAIYACDNMELCYDTLVFSPDMIGACENDRSAVEYIHPLINGAYRMEVKVSPVSRGYPELQKTVENIFIYVKSNLALNDLMLKSELMHLFWLLENMGYICHYAQNRRIRSEALKPVIEYINANYHENITIEQLSEIAHLSKSYFMSSFKKVAGIGAIEHITQLRIKAACEMLEGTDQTAAEIAFACGFGNISNFNRHFRRIVGCTPNEYRKISKTLLP